jgi:hypothetical protein
MIAIESTSYQLTAKGRSPPAWILRLHWREEELSWQLFGGVGDEDQFLNVHVVGTRLGPPE